MAFPHTEHVDGKDIVPIAIITDTIQDERRNVGRSQKHKR